MKTFYTLFAILSFIYAANAQFTINYETIDPICYGSCEGKIKITSASGGTAPYTLTLEVASQSITNYNGTDTVYFNNLCSGTYSVQITDSYNSTIAYQDNIIINSPQEMTYNVTTTDPTCTNACDGTAQINIVNGTPPYQFNLNGDTNTTGIFTNLCAESYYPIIFDHNGCELYGVYFQITDPLPIEINYNEVQPSSCTSTDGSITANVTQGTSPYTYLWSNSETTTSIDSIGVGIYHLTVTDANGCVKISHDALNAINSYITINGDEPTCYGYNDGKIYITSAMLSIGFPGYITWSYESTPLYYDTIPNISSLFLETLTNLPAGNYFLTLTDSICSNYAYYELTQPDSIKIETDEISDVTCYGLDNGYIFTNVSGGTEPYTYTWNNNMYDYYLYNLYQGFYTVTVSDSHGCTNQSTFEISQPDSFTASVTPVNISCNGYSDGYLLVIPNGGTSPYYFTLDSANSYNYQQLTDDTVWVVQPGTYSIFIKDANYCDTLAFHNLTINEPTLLQISNVSVTDPTCLNNDGSITVLASGGTGSYSYLLNNDSTTNTISNLSAGTYSLTIYDENSCETDTSLTLSMSSQLPVISGNVLFNQIYVDSSKILLFASGQFGAAQWDTVAIAQGPTYYFNQLKPGQYLLKANYLGQTFNVLNTYYNEKLYWTDADIITVTCNDTSYQNINLVQLPTNSGVCSMSGYVHYVSNKNGKAASEPVPGAEIAVEQVPGPTTIKMALTDSTGFYNLSDLPDLPNCNLRVDIPGFPMLSTYTGLSLSAVGNDSLANMNFLVDTATDGGIMIDTILWTNSLYNSPAKIIISPNPVISQSNVDVYLNNAENVNIKIVNVQGNTVYTYSPQTFEKGKNSFTIQKNQIPSSGIYYMVVQTSKYTYIKKFIKQ